MNKKFLRLLIGALLPAPIGLIVIGLFLAVIGESSWLFNIIEHKNLTMFCYIIAAGYLLLGIPSILYLLIMEFLVNSNFEENNIVVGVSFVLGGMAGATLPADKRFLVFLGVFVGILMGIILRKMYVNDCLNAK